ncbi:MAG: class I SAM-dependent methyltransferase [Promethearchaeota archaeon]
MDKDPNPWNSAFRSWLAFNKSGRNIHRDYLNLPAFITALPSPEPSTLGLEIGGGEGTLARKLTALGYKLHSTDFSSRMIEEARRIESESPLGIQYSVENAEKLSFSDNSFDFAIAFMILMDLHYPAKAFSEAFRILKPGGYFQISMIHPCFGTPGHRKHLLDSNGKKIGVEVWRYNEEGLNPVKWNYPPEPAFTTFHHHLTLSHWIMFALRAGFKLEHIDEPYATPEIIEVCPHLKHTVTIPDNLIMRFRKEIDFS